MLTWIWSWFLKKGVIYLFILCGGGAILISGIWYLKALERDRIVQELLQRNYENQQVIIANQHQLIETTKHLAEHDQLTIEQLNDVVNQWKGKLAYDLEKIRQFQDEEGDVTRVPADISHVLDILRQDATRSDRGTGPTDPERHP